MILKNFTKVRETCPLIQGEGSIPSTHPVPAVSIRLLNMVCRELLAVLMTSSWPLVT